MITMLILILWNPGRNVKKHKNSLLNNKITTIIVFFFIGIYGGFIQAGVGILIISTLTIMSGLSLVRINSIKVFVVGLYTLSSLIIFISTNNIDWLAGLLLACGNSLGAYLGSNLAIKKGDKPIKFILTIAVISMSIKLIIE